MLFQSTSDTIVAGMLLSLTYIKLIQLLQPFTDPELNRIKETSIWQLFFVFQIALLLKTNSGKSEVLSVCLLIVFFINFIILLGKYLVKYWLRHVCAGMLRGVKRQSGGDEIVRKWRWKKGALPSLPFYQTRSLRVPPDSRATTVSQM